MVLKTRTPHFSARETGTFEWPSMRLRKLLQKVPTVTVDLEVAMWERQGSEGAVRMGKEAEKGIGPETVLDKEDMPAETGHKIVKDSRTWPR